MKKWIFIGILIIVMVIVFCGIIGQTKNNDKEAFSKTEAIDLLGKKYEEAIKLYDISSEYFDIDEEYETIDGVQYYKIKNYETVLRDNFSEEVFKDFEEKATCLVIIDKKPYLAEGGRGFSTYAGVEEFKDITITNNKITAIVKTKHNDMDGNFFEYKESTFSIIKNGDNWIINEFNFNDVNNANID